MKNRHPPKLLTLCALMASAALAPMSARGQVPEIYYSPSRNISNSAWLSQSSAITQDAAQAIYLSWGEEGALLFVRSDDDGKTFTPPRRMTPHPGFGFGQGAMAGAGPGVVHAAVRSGASGMSEIVFLRTTDGGATFSPPGLLSTIDDFDSIQPDIASGWAIAVAWGDSNFWTGEDAVMYTQSLDQGATFSRARRLSAPTQGFKGCPDVAVAGAGNVYVAWTESLDLGVFQIWFSRSVDGGTTFSAPVTISSQPPQVGGCPRLVVDGTGNIFAFWSEVSPLGGHMVFTRSLDAGASFSAPTALYPPGAAPHSPEAVVTADGTVLVTWRTGEYHAYRCGLVAVKADGTFSAPVEPPVCGRMSARTAGALHVTWFNIPPATPWDVFYNRGEVRPMGAGRSFFVVPPCRVADTRGAEGPALAANTRRTFSVGGRCGIPLDAVAVASNVTTTHQSDVGNLRVFGAGGALPNASTINFVPGRTRANNATIALGTDAAVAVQCDMAPGSAGSTHFILDVNGYFR